MCELLSGSAVSAIKGTTPKFLPQDLGNKAKNV